MKREICTAVAAVLMLCACGAPDTAVAELRTYYEQLETAQLRGEITSHLAQESRSFTVVCDYTKDGDSHISVEAPQELAPLRATVGDELHLTWEDMTLAAGRSEALSPCTCPVWLMHAAAEGYVVEWNRETWEDTPCLRLALDTTAPDGTKVLCTIWCTEDGYAPVYAEFSADGALTLSMQILSFTPGA